MGPANCGKSFILQPVKSIMNLKILQVGVFHGLVLKMPEITSDAMRKLLAGEMS